MYKKITVFIIFILINFLANSQFTSISQPSVNSFLFVKINEPAGVAIAGGYSLIKSTDAGFTWTQHGLGNYGVPLSFDYVFKDACIISSNTYILVGYNSAHHSGVIIRTTDGGLSWNLVLETPLNGYRTLYHVTQNGNGTLVAACSGGAYRSIDNGLSWTYVFQVTAVPGFPNITYNKTTDNFIFSQGSSIWISSNEGASWSSIPSIFNTKLISITNQTSDLLFTYTNPGVNLVEMNNSNLASDSIIINPPSLSSSACLKSFYLPNGNIFVETSNNFLNINPITNEILFYDHQLINLSDSSIVSALDFDMGQTYGLAVGNFGALSRFDLNAPEQMHVLADFTINSTICPGDTLFADIDFPNGDSVKWYMDDIFVSTDINLSYVLPYNFYGTHELKLKNYYNGSYREDSLNINVYLDPAPQYHVTVYDTMVCFNTKASIHWSYISGSLYSGTYIDVFFNDSLIYGPVASSSNSFFIYSPIINGVDTLTFRVSQDQTCGTHYDSTQFIITSGLDLRPSFHELPNIDSICSGNSLEMKFDSLTPNYNYQVSFANANPNYGYGGYQYNFNSNNGDTATITTNVIYTPNGVHVNGYSDFNIKISDSYGCSQTVNLFDSVRVFPPPTVDFYTSSDSYYLGDTAVISNNNVALHRQWSINDTNAVFTNDNDTVPFLWSNTPGLIKIKLVNNSMTCTDSDSLEIRYAEKFDSIPLNVCEKYEAGKAIYFQKAKLDAEGNLYTLSTQPTASFQTAPGYSIQKYDPDGNLIWSRHNLFVSDIYGITMEGFDFDAEGNVYFAYWINANHSFTDSFLVDYHKSNISGLQVPSVYIVKLNKDNGALIWAQNIKDYPILLYKGGNANYPYLWKITDILVSKISNRIYFTLCNGIISQIVCIDMNRNFISSDWWGNTAQYLGTFPYFKKVRSGNTGSDSRSSYQSPKLYELSSGVIVGISYYGGIVKHQDQIIPGISNVQGLVAFKYTPVKGLYEFKMLCNFPTYHPYYDFPMAGVDKNDNITIAVNFSNSVYNNFIMGSVIPANYGTAVFQIDSSFSLNWITTGSSSKPQDLSVAKETGEILLSGLTINNVSFGNDIDMKMIGGDQVSSDSIIYPNSIYFMHFSENGTPTNANIYKKELGQYYSLEFASVRSVVTPCGDFISIINNEDWSSPVHVDHPPTFNLNIQGSEVTVDSTLIIKWSNDCVNEPNGCSYVTLLYDSTLYSCNTVSDSVSIIFPDAYLIDSVVYQLLTSGALSPLQSQQIDNQSSKIYVPIGTTAIYVLDPVVDTIQIEDGGFNTTYSYSSHICDGNSNLITNTDVNLSYLWPDSSTSNSYQLNDTSYTIGNNLIVVKTTNEYGCINMDTLSFVVNQTINPNIQVQDIDTVYCNDHAVIPYLSSNYSTVAIFLNGSAVTNDFSSQNLMDGINVVHINFIDINGCYFDTAFTMNYIECSTSLGIKEMGGESDKFMLLPNPSNGNFKVIVPTKNVEYQITITDDLGRRVYQKESSGYKEILMETNFPPGHYLIQIESSEDTWRTQFIIQ